MVIDSWPKVSVIIPHWKGKDILQRCLRSLHDHPYEGPLEIVIVDNDSPDHSLDILQYFPRIKVLHSPVNLGYAGGCNLGILQTSSPYIFLLNNDAYVTKSWLEPLVGQMTADPRVAVVQPKIRSIQNPSFFDYCGAAGGEIDIFGYPFARGRLFESIEVDNGQYDHWPQSIFWASGAACLLRRSALHIVGLFEESFFAHMEEIDLNWRLQWAGFRVVAEPQSIIMHQTGATLSSGSLKKMILNHRNSLVMLFRNLPLSRMVWIIPVRLFLEVATAAYALINRDIIRFKAVVIGFFQVFSMIPSIYRGRKNLKSFRSVNSSMIMNRMYFGSAPWSYYLRHQRTANALMKNKYVKETDTPR